MDKIIRTIFDKSLDGKTGYILPKLDVPEIGLDKHISKKLLKTESFDMPQVTEPEVVRHFVNLSTKNETETVYERSDTCAVPRAVPIFESAMALEILKNLLIKTGGDSKKEITKNFENISKLHLDEFDLDNKTWNMKYET